MSAADGSSEPPHVVAVPYPGRGHINPMLVLCRLLAVRGGAAVTLVLTEEWLSLISPASLPSSITVRTIPNVVPSEHVRAADFTGFLEAVRTRMEAPFERLLDSAGNVSAIVADSYLPWAVAVGERRRVPVCSLFTMSATFFSALFHFGVKEDLNEHVPGIIPDDLTSLSSMKRPLEISLDAFSWIKKANCLLFTSFSELEPTVFGALKQHLPFPVYPIGPLIPYMTLEEKQHYTPSDSTIFTWLDTQRETSVLYVSLGSFLSVSAAQMEEFAFGLRDSGTTFLWVARGESVSLRLQAMTWGRGLVVPWVDQLKVLCHPSVGGFLTHCGWNSTLEAVFAGVPMLTLPIFWDQPVDSRLVVDVWKIGFSLKGLEEEDPSRGNLISRDCISEVVRKLMDGDESREIRRRVKEMKEACGGALIEGGSSYDNLNAFINKLKQGFHC